MLYIHTYGNIYIYIYIYNTYTYHAIMHIYLPDTHHEVSDFHSQGFASEQSLPSLSKLVLTGLF